MVLTNLECISYLLKHLQQNYISAISRHKLFAPEAVMCQNIASEQALTMAKGKISLT